MQTAVNESKSMFRRNMNRTHWAIEKVQVRKKGKVKINVLSKKQTKRVLQEKSCNFNRIDLVNNLHSPFIKFMTSLACREWQWESEECGFFFRMAPYVRYF